MYITFFYQHVAKSKMVLEKMGRWFDRLYVTVQNIIDGTDIT